MITKSMVIGAIANIKRNETKTGKVFTTFGVKYDYDGNTKKGIYCNCIIWGDYSATLNKGKNYMVFGLVDKNEKGCYDCKAQYITECVMPSYNDISKETSEALNSMLSDDTPFN